MLLSPTQPKYCTVSYSIFSTRRGPLKRRTFCEAATQLLQIRPRGPAPTSHPQHWNEQIGQWEDAAGQPRPDATRNQRRVELRRGTQREPRNRSAASKLANAIYAERCRAVRSAARRHECSANLASAPGPTSKSIALAHRYECTPRTVDPAARFNSPARPTNRSCESASPYLFSLHSEEKSCEPCRASLTRR